MATIPATRPTKRTVDIRSLSYGLSGPIPPYPVYQFSGYRTKYERDRHNPFALPTNVAIPAVAIPGIAIPGLA